LEKNNNNDESLIPDKPE